MNFKMGIHVLTVVSTTHAAAMKTDFATHEHA
jgi:hypothetical protein